MKIIVIDGKKLLLIEEKYCQLKDDIERDYYGEDKFLLRMFSSADIISAGFCASNIIKIVKDCDKSDIEEYFDKFVSGFNAEYLGGIEIMDNTGRSTIGEIITEIKRKAIYNFLNIELSKFIQELKDDSRKIN